MCSSDLERNYKVTLFNDKIPDNINEVNNNILNDIIECEHKGICNDNCQKAFKIVPDELSFYRRHNIPIPRMCLNCCHQSRVKERNPLNSGTDNVCVPNKTMTTKKDAPMNLKHHTLQKDPR